ncbi:MAG: pyridoxal 5'-phosphate synthase glutaminase subunit PdxT [Oscillospiraceae bacterium]|nr:pyridoxal 5'-phosphate synthase glutaminase subunit PdxT [Oscillospiraceae bacterium]
MAFGILALQGGFAEHGAMLGRLGAEHFEIRQLRDIQRPMDGLLLPGGESTVIAKLLKELGLFQPLREKIQAGLPVFGTCAGLILLAQQVEGGEPCFATMDISVKRNAYGRQLGSFFTEGRMEGVGRVPMTFIRAPYIAAAGEKAQVLAQVNGHIVAARQGRQLVTAFHPELNDDLSIHRWFLDEVAQGLWKR